jgi:hypothetical protein
LRLRQKAGIKVARLPALTRSEYSNDADGMLTSAIMTHTLAILTNMDIGVDGAPNANAAEQSTQSKKEKPNG